MRSITAPSPALRYGVLLWLALSWCLALASPALPGQGMTEVCTSHGVIWVNADEEPASLPVLAQDCDLCLPSALPAPAPHPAIKGERLRQAPPSPADLAAPAFPGAMPPPARGPPCFPFLPQEVSS